MIFLKQKISLETAPCDETHLSLISAESQFIQLVSFLKIFFDGSKMDVFNF